MTRSERVGTGRRRWAKDVETDVLLASRRRCALCFGLEGDASEKEGQIAHIDRDASNSVQDNAAWLCTKHHARYDSTSRQAKGHTAGELRGYRDLLHQHMASPIAWPDAIPRRIKATGVSVEVYDRRLPVYRATVEFIREAVKGTAMDLPPLWAFAAATDEALFLFDDELADFLRELYRRGVRLHALSAMLEPAERRTPDLVREHAEVVLWFSEQFDVARGKFARYLRLTTG